MVLNRAQLIDCCQQIMASYNPLRTTPATQADSFFAEKKLLKDEASMQFIREVFYGTERYTKVLKMTVDGLYERHSASVVRTDYNLYIIMTFLAVFRVTEMGLEEFRRFVLSQSPHKMHVWLSFIFAPEQIDKWLPNQWSLVYDHIYVQEQLIGTMKAFGDDMNAMIAELDGTIRPAGLSETMGGEGEANGTMHSGTMRKQSTLTKPVPFNLTEPKPRPIPVPPVQFQTTGYKARPIPETIHQTSLEQIEREKRERKKQIKSETLSKYQSPTEGAPATGKSGAFNLATMKRPSRKQKLLEEKERELADLQVNYKAKPMPNFPTPSQNPVKRTTATVLREEAMYRKAKREEDERIKQFEMELRDSADFETWKATMLAKDEQEEQEMMEQRRQEMARAAQEAAASVERNIQEKHGVAMKAKEDSERWRVEREQEIEVEKELKKKMKEEVQAAKENVAVARAKLEEEKKEIVENVRKNKEKRAKLRAKMEKEEMEKRKQLIKEIQAMEKVSNQRAKRPVEFDPSEASGVGLLEEMSLVELAERVKALKIREEEELKAKRKAIRMKKQEKEDALEQMVRNHERIRARQHEEMASDLRRRRAEETAARLKSKQALAEKEVVMQEKLQTKRERARAQALKLARELKARRVELNFLAAERAHQAEIAARDVKRGAARAERERLRAQQEAEEAYQKSKAVDTKIRIKNQKEHRRQQKLSRKNYDKRVHQTLKESDQFYKDETALKVKQAKESKSRREAAIQKAKSLNPFATQIANRALKQAQARKNRTQDLKRTSGKRHRNLKATMPGRSKAGETQVEGEGDGDILAATLKQRAAEGQREGMNSQQSTRSVHFEQPVAQGV